MAHPFQLLIVDARQTAERLRADARRMRDIAGRAKVAARFAGAQAKAKLDQGLEKVADAILEFEARTMNAGRGRRE